MNERPMMQRGAEVAPPAATRIALRWNASIPADETAISTDAVAGVATSMFRDDAAAERRATHALAKWRSLASAAHPFDGGHGSPATSVLAAELHVDIEMASDAPEATVHASITGPAKSSPTVAVPLPAADEIAATVTRHGRHTEIAIRITGGEGAADCSDRPLLVVVLSEDGDGAARPATPAGLPSIRMIRGELPARAGFPAGALAPPTGLATPITVVPAD